VFFHHPYRSREGASSYDWDRLADELRPYNVVLILYGHGHQANHQFSDEFDLVQGGETFQAKGAAPPGGNVIDVREGTIRIAYKAFEEAAATKPSLEKRIPERSSYPKITCLEPNPRRLA